MSCSHASRGLGCRQSMLPSSHSRQSCNTLKAMVTFGSCTSRTNRTLSCTYSCRRTKQSSITSSASASGRTNGVITSRATSLSSASLLDTMPKNSHQSTPKSSKSACTHSTILFTGGTSTAKPCSNSSFQPKEAEHKALSHSAVSYAEVNRHKENLRRVKASQPHSATDFLCAIHICQVPHFVRFPSITLCYDATYTLASEEIGKADKHWL